MVAGRDGRSGCGQGSGGAGGPVGRGASGDRRPVGALPGRRCRRGAGGGGRGGFPWPAGCGPGGGGTGPLRGRSSPPVPGFLGGSGARGPGAADPGPVPP